MKTRELKNTHYIHDIYIEQDRVTFCPVSDRYTVNGYDTTCKEEIGAQCVHKKAGKFVIIVPTRLTTRQVTKVLRYVNKREVEAKVKVTTIERVKDKSTWLLINHSKRWSRNSVAHSILVTWLRYAITEDFPYMDWARDRDDDHLIYCRWLLDAVKKKGLRVFGTSQHPKYDIGMVSLMSNLRHDKLAITEPHEDSYDSMEEFDIDYNQWMSDSYDSDLDDLELEDSPGMIPTNQTAYTTLIEMHNGKPKSRNNV